MCAACDQQAAAYGLQGRNCPAPCDMHAFLSAGGGVWAGEAPVLFCYVGMLITTSSPHALGAAAVSLAFAPALICMSWLG